MRPPFPIKHFLLDGVYTVVLCTICALLISLVVGKQHMFFPNLVVSLCIGLLAWAPIDLLRLSVWRQPVALRWGPFLAVTSCFVPLAYYGGSKLAGRLLGIPAMPSWSMFTFTLVASACLTLFFTSRERMVAARAAIAQEKNRADQTMLQATRAQLQLLQAQIEPHMLFNTLANLQGLIALDPERAQRMLDHLIQYLRATLGSSRAGATTLGQEFALMEAYLGLMSVRMGTRLSYALTLPEALRAIALPPMLLQPLVENAITHGLEPKIDGGHIAVDASHDGVVLRLRVADSGLGLHAGPGRPGHGVGIFNTRARLLALYGEGAGLSLEAGAAGGAVACLTLPIAHTPKEAACAP
ncbi:sensor histidine kinase [Massilia glaciei]|uniref:Sensor histidine kinase n=1 Tax=Massilia glaciei TaxID=1524097 RepID=A0A2U2HEJ6_9BURK|nr:histidine kinase [Massilia glaciei]PWF42067.1 sensor histidine kinase [Massilia glaciei]